MRVLVRAASATQNLPTHPFGSKKINHDLEMNESGANPCQVRRVVVHGYATKADQTLYAFEQEYCIQ